MIQKGIDINRLDVYQDTPLDYLIYAPNFEMQTLLIENGATSGFLTAVLNPGSDGLAAYPQQISAGRKATDLLPGATMSVRLDGPVFSDRSRTGNVCHFGQTDDDRIQVLACLAYISRLNNSNHSSLQDLRS